MSSVGRINKDDSDPNADLVEAGFNRLDTKLLNRKNPPKIKWGNLYRESSKDDKLDYLEKLCASMNQAAYLIQDERNQLGELCEKKEEQLESMKRSVQQNESLLHEQIAEINAERQQFNKSIADLKREVRELKNGGNG